METYPATEGFLGWQDLLHGGLRPFVSHGVFYEFVPVDEYIHGRHESRCTLEQVSTGVEYVVVLSTCAGLWGYVLGDTVSFIRREPLQFVITGNRMESSLRQR